MGEKCFLKKTDELLKTHVPVVLPRMENDIENEKNEIQDEKRERSNREEKLAEK